MPELKKLEDRAKYKVIAVLVVTAFMLLIVLGMMINRDINASTMKEAFTEVRAAWLARDCRASQFHGASRGYIDSILAGEIGLEGENEDRATRDNILKIRKFGAGLKKPKDGDWCARGNVRCIYGPGNGIFSDSDWYCVRLKN